jgi:hypothetical protein
MNELSGVGEFIYSKLAADSAFVALVGTKVYPDVAPQGTAHPFVIHQFLSAQDRGGVGERTRIFTRPVFLIKAVTLAGNYAQADQIADRIDEVFLGQKGTAESGQLIIQGCHRIQPIRYSEIISGVRYNHCGGQYRFFVHKRV